MKWCRLVEWFLGHRTPAGQHLRAELEAKVKAQRHAAVATAVAARSLKHGVQEGLSGPMGEIAKLLEMRRKRDESD